MDVTLLVRISVAMAVAPGANTNVTVDRLIAVEIYLVKRCLNPGVIVPGIVTSANFTLVVKL
jgi:hypothetical protein